MEETVFSFATLAPLQERALRVLGDNNHFNRTTCICMYADTVLRNRLKLATFEDAEELVEDLARAGKLTIVERHTTGHWVVDLSAPVRDHGS